MPHKYTEAQAKFIAENVTGTFQKDLTLMFNNHFGLSLKVTQIRAFIKNHGLKSGLDCRIKPGNVPFNKGIKGMGGWEPTQFKKGNRPVNYRPIGSERVNVDDYVEVKIADPNKWRGKHIVVWEQHNGPLSKGYAVIFGDGDRRNFELNNLIRVSRQQLLILNKNKLIQNNADLTRTGVIIADLYQKISKRKVKTK
jgi:hypothetical protein